MIDIKQAMLPPSLVAAAIHHMRHTGVSLYVHGAPGISKSAVARQVADRCNIAFIDFRLTSVAPEDIRGVPMLDDAGGMKGMIWTPPLVLPRDLDLAGTQTVSDAAVIRFYNPVGNNHLHYCQHPQITVSCPEPGKTARLIEQRLDNFVVSVTDADGRTVAGTVVWRVTGKSAAIFALEEFNSATPSVMAAAYQLILDRRMGDYIVPDDVMLLAMGNRRGDKGVTFELPKPVANRFIHIEMTVSFDDWQDWAVHSQINADVVGYLSNWKSHLFEDNFAKSPDHSFATPRSWEFVSQVVSREAPPAVIKALVCGAVGEAVGTQFIAHRDYMADMPNVENILSGQLTIFSPRQPNFKTQIAYSTCVQLCYALKNEMDGWMRLYSDQLARRNSVERRRWNMRADHAVGYVLDNFTPEVITMFNRMAMMSYNLPFSTETMPRFRDFSDQFLDSIVGT